MYISQKHSKKASIRNHANLSKEPQNISAGSIRKHFLSKKVYSDFKLKTWQGQMGIVVVLPALLVTFWAGELNFLEGTKSFLWHFHEPLCKPNEIFRISLCLLQFQILFRNMNLRKIWNQFHLRLIQNGKFEENQF